MSHQVFERIWRFRQREHTCFSVITPSARRVPPDVRWSMRLTADRAPPGAHRCMPISVEPLTGYDMLPTISDAHEARALV